MTAASSSGRWARWRVRATAALLAIATFVLVLRNQADVGIARDETVYMDAARKYAQWWVDFATFKHGASSTREITAHFGGNGATDNNREHPPLMKTLFGLSERWLHQRLGWASELTAFRAPSALVHAGLIALVFAWTAGVWGYAEGLIAALLLLLMPRLFFHAGLACFDAPIAAWWFAAVIAYGKALVRGPAVARSPRPIVRMIEWLVARRWVFGAGVAFGLALATKHNAVLLPVAFVVHAGWIGWRPMIDDWRQWRRDGAGGGVSGWARATWALTRRRWTRPERVALVGIALVGPLTLIALWPWLWFDTFAHLNQWMAFHLHHVHYNFEYLGQNWNHPPFPWHVAIVTTLFTVPVVTLVAALLGGGVLIARWRRGASADPARAPALLLFLSAGASMGPFLLGSTPIFGAEKHWAAAMPSLAIGAGIGTVWAARQAARWITSVWAKAARRPARVEGAAIAGVAVMMVLAAGVETFHAQPYALTEYNALAGGAPGGADLGMNRQFWGFSVRGALGYIASQAPAAGAPPRRVYTHDASPAWGYYVREGLVPSSMPDAGGEYAQGIERSELALVVHELHFNRHDYLIWKAYGTVQPAYVLRVDGVPIVSVYRRPGR